MMSWVMMRTVTVCLLLLHSQPFTRAPLPLRDHFYIGPLYSSKNYDPQNLPSLDRSSSFHSVVRAHLTQLPGDVSRVIDSWDNIKSGEILTQQLVDSDRMMKQEARSFLPNLTGNKHLCKVLCWLGFDASH
mgnify:FL=1